MNILITGSEGYVGSALVPKLVERGHKVTRLDTLLYGPAADIPTTTFIKGDIGTHNPDWFEDIDVVVNLAAFSNDPTANAFPDLNHITNVVAAVRCAHQAKLKGVRKFIQASTASIYDGAPDTVCTEESFTQCRGYYPISKLQAERNIRNLSSERFDTVMLRKGTIYGMSPRMRFDLVVNKMVRDALVKKEIVVHNFGRMSRPMLHIDSAITAYVRVIEFEFHPKITYDGAVYNVLNDNYTIAELALMVKKVLPDTRLHFAQVAETRDYKVSGKKFIETFGNLTRTHFIEPTGVTMIDHISAMAAELSTWTIEELLHPRHDNIQWLKIRQEILGHE